METGERTHRGLQEEKKLYQKRARRILPFLIRQAKAKQTIFYSDLAAEMDMPNPRSLNFVLGAVGGELEQLSSRWKLGSIPPLQCLVINKQDGTPGNGIGWFVANKSEFKKLAPTEKRRVIDSMLVDVFNYGHWNRVLEEYGFTPIQVASEAALKEESEEAIRRFGSGGEGADHEAFKTFIAGHPEALSLPSKLRGEVEHGFPSGDCLDVLFRNGTEWIGVEVKGPISDDLDLNRGIFQCVKYQALLEAEQKLLQRGVNVKMILAICRSLPDGLKQRRLVLHVDVRKIIFPQARN